jgi:endonuclease/exonuclease/phosphatase family metal-dependent hydrolase
MNYWQNTKGDSDKVINWKNNCINYLKEMEKEKIVFFILQEINPFRLFEISPNQYFTTMTNCNILYNELKRELILDGRKYKFWGNAILFNKNFTMEKNNMKTDEKDYYGKNAIMCYDFKTPDGKMITIINYYNKNNHTNKIGYNVSDEIKNDIKKILEEKKENIIIFAGDFNKGFREDHRNCINENYDDFIELYNQEYSLIDCIKNYKEEFIHTSFHKGKKYLNDFCFTKNIFDELVNKKDEWDNKNLWKGLSDHRALIIELKIE